MVHTTSSSKAIIFSIHNVNQNKYVMQLITNIHSQSTNSEWWKNSKYYSMLRVQSLASFTIVECQHSERIKLNLDG